MKTLAGISGILGIILTSCTSTYYATTPVDDVYSSGKQTTVKTVTTTTPSAATPATQAPVVYENPAYSQQAVATEQAAINDTSPQYPSYTNTETYYAPDGNVVVTETSVYGEFNPDNYYDYAYSARINRFHSPVPGYSYYDDYYTNSYYYSNYYDDWGASIYFGYPWASPYIGFGYGGFSIGFGWGYPYYGYGYYPYYGYGYPYYGGYYGGCCYNSWYSGYYCYNSYDNNTHYGPRDSGGRGSNHSGGKSAGGRAESAPFGDRYEKAIAASGNAGTRSSVNNESTRSSFNNEGNRSSTPAKITPNADTRSGNTEAIRSTAAPAAAAGTRTVTPSPSTKTTVPASNNDRFTNPGSTKAPATRYHAPASKTPTQKQTNLKPAPRTYTPNNSQQRYAKPKTYNSPNYTKPKSPQEYVSPKSERAPSQNPNVKENSVRQAPVNGDQKRDRLRESSPSQSRPSYESGSGNSGGSRSSGGNSGGGRSSGGSSGGSNSGSRSGTRK